MERRLGHDFGRVRVHADATAARSARALGAAAYTVGQHVVFGASEFAPGTPRGERVLAHELAHTIQQRSGRRRSPDDPAMTPSDGRLELEARDAAGAVELGRTASVQTQGPVQVARQEDPERKKPPDPAGGETKAPPKTDEGPESKETSAPGGEGKAEPADESAPKCPVKKDGTLSEVSWGETSGIYPTSKNKFQPDKWDAAKTCELLAMRGAVHEVGKRGERVHKGKPKEKDAVEQKLKPYHLIENFPSLDAEIADKGVKWFFLSPKATDSHPGIKNEERVKTYGKFYNIGGGDVKKGDVYVHFFKLKAKPKKPAPKKPPPKKSSP